MFLVLALPRSRTFWLSKLLTYRDHDCGHEEARVLRSVDDARIWLKQEFHGSCETALAPFWRLLAQVNPSLRVVVVRRPVEEVVRSFMALPLRDIIDLDEDDLRRQITRLDAKLRQLSKRLPNVLAVDYDELDEVETARAIFEHCLPYRFDLAWWQKLRAQHLECNMRAMTRYMLAYRPAVERMAKIATGLSRAQLLTKPPVSADGVTFQQERFDDWIRDGVPLFREHCLLIGEPPDNWRNKNLPLIKHMCETGFMQITTARANGRMFGYLVAPLNPSVEARDALAGLHTSFYVSKDMPGIGMKLQRASIAALKAKGAGEVWFYEGIRGSGPRLGAFYRRLGAHEAGKLYRLQFEGIA